MRYLHILRRRLWLLILNPLIAVAAVTAVSLWLPPVYEARVAVLVRPAQPLTVEQGAASLTSDQISRTYASLMTERPLLEKVISDLSLSMSPDDLKASVTVTPEASTTILDVTVRNSDPRLARDIANQLVSDFIVQVKQIQKEETQTPNARSSDNLVVVSPAVTPTVPVSPKLYLNIGLAAGAGLLISLLFIFLAEYLDQTIRSDDELIRRVGLMPIGHIPYASGGKKKMAELVAGKPQTPVAEAYKSLRTNLLFASIDREARVIVITSPSVGEGKSRTSANLGMVLAQAGHRTLLVDADFRRPSLHKTFGRVRNVGLSNFFLRDEPENELVHQFEEVPNLWVITSGPTPPNPSELLGSGLMRDLLARFRGMFSYVLIDTPPLNVVTDPLILAGYADATVMVVEQGRTTYPAVAHAKRSLHQVGAHLLGVVVNKMRSASGDYYYYDYAYFSGDGSNGNVEAAVDAASASPVVKR
jgi:capsular exopolysaccharide synthesis family protein